MASKDSKGTTGGIASMPKKPAAFKPTYKTGSGTKAGAFKVNNPVGHSTTKTTPDVTNSFPGRSNSDVANPSGLRGRESMVAYAKGRSYGE